MAYLKMDANLTAEELSEKILDEIKSLSSWELL
jgi:hypothetical protein